MSQWGQQTSQMSAKGRILEVVSSALLGRIQMEIRPQFPWQPHWSLMSSHTHLLVYSRCKLHFFLNILSTSALELICHCCFLIFSHLLVLCLCHPNSFSPSFCSSVYLVNILSFTAFASIFHSPLNSVAFVIDLLDTPLPTLVYMYRSSLLQTLTSACIPTVGGLASWDFSDESQIHFHSFSRFLFSKSKEKLMIICHSNGHVYNSMWSLPLCCVT